MTNLSSPHSPSTVKRGHSNSSLRIRKLALILLCVVTPLYLIWRVTVINADAPVFGWVLFTGELWGLTSLLWYFFSLGEVDADEDVTDKNFWCEIDVLITTINEPIEMIRRTAAAARDMNIEHETYILDDGNRQEVRELADQLGVRYVARSTNQFAKAGNLNNALAHAHGEFFAIFDCDHVPAPDFLERTLGHMSDNHVAIVQTPQCFYNDDSLSSWTSARRKKRQSEQETFYLLMQPTNALRNTAILCGTCALIRRSAIDGVGGFATDTVTEDLQTSIRLQAAGWKIKCLTTPLAFGVAPRTIDAFGRQRQRWATGGLQTLLKEKPFLMRGLNLKQRWVHTLSLFFQLDGLPRLMCYLSPVFMLITGTTPIVADPTQYFFILGIYFATLLFAQVALSGGRISISAIGYKEILGTTRIWSQLSTLRAILKSKFEFDVTPKTVAKKTKKSLSMHVLFPATLGCVCIAAILYGAYRFFVDQHLSGPALAAGIFWTALVAMTCFPALIWSARRNRDQRSEERFQVGNDWSIEVEHGPELSLVDINSSGFRAKTHDTKLVLDSVCKIKLYKGDEELEQLAQLEWVSESESPEDSKEVGFSFQHDGLEVMEMERKIYPALLRPDFEVPVSAYPLFGSLEDASPSEDRVAV